VEGPLFSGTAFPRGGAGTRCSLKPGADGLEIGIPGGPRVVWPYDSLDLEPAGDEGAYLLIRSSRSPDGPLDSVTVRDPAFNEALAERMPSARGFIRDFALHHRRNVSHKWRNLLFGGAAFLALLFGGYWAITHGAAEWASKKMPVPLELKWGSLLSRSFLASRKVVSSGAAHDAAQALFARLKEALPKDNPYPLELHVVEDPMVNAFALPGGQVVLMTGLMKDARSPEEVAGVLAHEIQHVLKRHVVKRLVQEMGWRAWFSLFFGGGDLSGIAFGAGSLMQLSYGRAQETEADVEGAKLLQAAGIPAGPLASFFERLSGREGAASKVPAFISTHPESRKRAEELKRLAGTLAPKDPRPLEVDWEAVQEALK
jgi:Zn-dependent protease with chaperone function